MRSASDATSAQATLSWEERARYARHLTLPQVGPEGQARLKQGRVLLVGAGGLGSPLALYLAAAGVGTLGLADFDRVDLSNLQRQILHTSADVGRPKLDSAAERIRAINPHVRIETHPVRLSADNALDIIAAYDLVADGTDSFATRYLINDACVFAGVPNVYGSVFRFEGQVSVFGAPGGPNIRDVFPEPPPPDEVPSCAEGGVLGILPGLVGTLQATEVLKWLLDIGTPLVGRLLLVDALTMRFRELRVEPDPANPLTGTAPTIHSLRDDPLYCAPPSPQPAPLMASVPELSVTDYQALRDSENPPFLLDVRRPEETEIATLGGTLIPIDELEGRIDELEEHRDDEQIVVMCRSGARSARAVEILQQHGFTNAVNLKGGVLAWSDEVDPSMPTY